MKKEKAMPTNKFQYIYYILSKKLILFIWQSTLILDTKLIKRYQDGSILKSYVLFPMMREVGWIFKFPQIRFIPLIVFKSLW